MISIPVALQIAGSALHVLVLWVHRSWFRIRGSTFQSQYASAYKSGEYRTPTLRKGVQLSGYNLESLEFLRTTNASILGWESEGDERTDVDGSRAGIWYFN